MLLFHDLHKGGLVLLAGTQKMTAFYGAVIEIPADTQLDITLVGSAVPGRIKAIPASIMPYFSPGVAGAITKGKPAHISCRYIQQPGNSYKYVSIVLAHTLFQAEGLSSCGSSAGASRNILKMSENRIGYSTGCFKISTHMADFICKGNKLC